jgi:hypothetical protein
MLTPAFQTAPFSYASGQSGGSVFAMFTLPQPDPTNEVTPLDATDGQVIVPEVSLDYLILNIALTDTSVPFSNFSIMQYKYDATVGNLLATTKTVPGIFFAAVNAFLSVTGICYFNWQNSGYLETVDPTTFSNANSTRIYASFFGIPYFGYFVQIDEGAGILISSIGYGINIYSMATGVVSYTLNMPDTLISLTMLGDGLHAYALCQNGVLILFDYTTGSVLKTFYVPPSSGMRWSSTQGAVCMYWYPTYNQLMICEILPAVGGINQTYVVGYKMMDNPNRLTNPLPLQKPAAGATIQVMTSLLDDLNRGIGGALIYSTVAGTGSLVSQGFTDYYGRALAKVSCDSAGTCSVESTVTVPDVVSGLTPAYPVQTGAGTAPTS